MIDFTRFAGTDNEVHGLMGRQQALRSEALSQKQKAAESHPIPKHKRGDRFIRGPIPFEWLRAALAIGGKSGNLAWAIWWLAGVERSNPTRLTSRVLLDFHISPRAARRLLGEFERTGLVELDRHRGRSPIVTILTPTPEEALHDRDRTDSLGSRAGGDQ